MTPQSRLGRLLAAPVVLPHELGHALPAVAAGLPVTVTLLPEWDGSQRPLGRFNAALDPSTPLWLVRLVAVAPGPLYVGLAAVLRVTVMPTGSAAVAAILCCGFWAAPSGGDIAVARNPAEARAAGEFLVTMAGSETRVADAATLAVTVLIGVVLLASATHP